MRNWILFIFFIVCHLFLQAAKPLYTLSGKITDASQEPVSFATLNFNSNKYITVADVDGKYEIKLEKGEYSGIVTAVSYRTFEFKIDLTKDTVFNIVMEDDAVQLQTVNVYGKTVGKQLEEGAFSGQAEISVHLLNPGEWSVKN